ncbi:MAG: hypothetical protein ACRC2T_00840, partial [Thermoguttaceae bacterium]
VDGKLISSPEDFYDVCYRSEFDRALLSMENPEKEIDHHKIIAITQKSILEFLPLRDPDNRMTDDVGDAVFKLNVKFAFCFGLAYLCAWNEYFYPKNHFVDENEPFKSERFIFPIAKTEIGKRFLEEHAKLLSAEPNTEIPTYSVTNLANIWFLIEQWCLTNARYRPDWPTEK